MTLRSAATRIASTLTPEDRPCCVYARRILGVAYGLPRWEDLPEAEVSAWHLWDVARPWSPVEQAMLAGIADRVELPPTVPYLRRGHWHLCQGWRGTPGAPGVSGHTWLWWSDPEVAGWGMRLDCAEAQHRAAPYHQEAIERWADRVAPYKGGVAVAVLRPVGR